MLPLPRRAARCCSTAWTTSAAASPRPEPIPPDTTTGTPARSSAASASARASASALSIGGSVWRTRSRSSLSISARDSSISNDSGTVDVYVTTADVDPADVTPTQSGLTTGTLGGFRELTAKTYRIRVTGTGDPADVRLDIPSIALTAKTFYTLVITEAEIDQVETALAALRPDEVGEP